MTTVKVGDIKVVFDSSKAVEAFDAVVVVLFFSEHLVLVRNEDRAWEFPGGHRERDETFAMTAEREVFEETAMRASGIEYLGYYVAPDGHVTIIACAEVSPEELKLGDHEVARVGLFAELPADLSFGDGRERLFYEHACAFRSGRVVDDAD